MFPHHKHLPDATIESHEPKIGMVLDEIINIMKTPVKPNPFCWVVDLFLLNSQLLTPHHSGLLVEVLQFWVQVFVLTILQRA